jgi:glycerol-3-phosphate dehydrogenase
MSPVDTLRCNLGDVSARHFEIIIVGGGIYGAMLALEAGMRGVSTLLVESDDFGGRTSANNLRILHGGLRHLQSLDLVRYWGSVAERRWYLRHFPELTRPLPFVMPLRGRGLQRRSVFHVALALNDALSIRRNSGVRHDRHLAGGRVIDPRASGWLQAAHFDIAADAAALWHDGLMVSPSRLIIDVLRWAVSLGGSVANYAAAVSAHPGQPCRVLVRDRITGGEHELRCSTVINATGGMWNALATVDAGKEPQPGRTLAWNLGLKLAPFANVAVGATSPADGNTYFLVPWRDRMMLGTAHDRLEPEQGAPTEHQIDAKLRAVRAAFPGFRVHADDIVRVFSGTLPGRVAGGAVVLDRRPTISRSGTGQQILTVNGVKFTTARRVADAVLTEVSRGPGARRRAVYDRPAPNPHWDVAGALESGCRAEALIDPLLEMAVTESAHSVDDLVHRRTTLGDATGTEAVRLVAALRERWRQQRTVPGCIPQETGS